MEIRFNIKGAEKIGPAFEVVPTPPTPSVTDYQSEEMQKKSFHSKELSKKIEEKMEEQIKKINEAIAASRKELRFKYNEEAKELYVEVLDSTTKEVVTSLPPDFLIDLSLKMKEIVGMFMDEKI